MSGLPLDDLRAALVRKGFGDLDGSGPRSRMVRRQSDRHDHVVFGLSPPPFWRRLARRPERVDEVRVGVLWPIGETAFSRSVPATPEVPQQVHAATGFPALVEHASSDAATVAAVVDDWCRRLEDPAHALEVGAINDPIRRLEFCAITADATRGHHAADAARAHVESLPPATRDKARSRIEVAEDRLPRD